MKRLLVFLLIPMLYASCNTATSVEELAAIQGEWRLQRLQVGGGGAVNVPIPARYTARFEPDGAVNFQVDCNRCSGSYTTDGNAITIGPLLACTLASCPPWSLSGPYLQGLLSAQRYVRSGATLVLSGSGTELDFLVAD
jgi:heat shock protein HslJ